MELLAHGTTASVNLSLRRPVAGEPPRNCCTTPPPPSPSSCSATAIELPRRCCHVNLTTQCERRGLGWDAGLGIRGERGWGG